MPGSTALFPATRTIVRVSRSHKVLPLRAQHDSLPALILRYTRLATGAVVALARSCRSSSAPAAWDFNRTIAVRGSRIPMFWTDQEDVSCPVAGGERPACGTANGPDSRRYPRALA